MIGNHWQNTGKIQNTGGLGPILGLFWSISGDPGVDSSLFWPFCGRLCLFRFWSILAHVGVSKGDSSNPPVLVRTLVYVHLDTLQLKQYESICEVFFFIFNK